jgi:hypothetical protein
MLKKIGFATLALAGLMVLASPKSDAAVRFGIEVGVPAYSYPYAYPHVYPNAYPYPVYGSYAHGYPYVGPSIGLGFGYGAWGRAGHGFHGGSVYRGGSHVSEGFHGGFHAGGHGGGRR